MTHSLTQAGLARRSVRFYWPVALSIAMGVAIATAVITGALVVGDSMRASLRGLTVDRLGRIDQIIIPGGFFDAGKLPSAVAGRKLYPVILFDQAVVEIGGGAEIRRAGSVQVLGVEKAFWELDPQTDTRPAGGFEIGDEEVVINRALADDLRAEVGDSLTVRLPAEQAVPADSPLGRRDSQTEGIPRLKVVAIIENRGLGRFALHPNQAEPMTVWLHRETIAETLQRDGRANVLLATAAGAGGDAGTEGIAGDPDDESWVDQIGITLDDLGLKLERFRKTFPESGDDAEVVFDYYSVSSDRLLLPATAVSAIRSRFESAETIPMLTYLANAIERVDETGVVTASVPYSTITAIDPSDALPLNFTRPGGDDASVAAENAQAPITPVPVVLNRWAADALSAAVGDSLRIAYYEPEVEGGKEIERHFDAVLTDIVPITTPSRPYRRNRDAEFGQSPTKYNDPHLTPSVPGVTDQDSISDWDLPFQLDREISGEDDRYWNDHRLTPKAFLPLADGRRLFGSRFGDTTSLRIEAATVGEGSAVEADVLAALLPDRDSLGWGVIPIRKQQLDASRGTTPFDALFLSLSFFVILAALMLIALLFRLGLMQRAREYGVLLATGFPGRSVSRLAISEGLWIAMPGILIGVLGGMLYAAAVLAALRSWWVGAVTVPFLEFHATGRSLLIGGVAGAAVSWLTLFVTARRLRRTPARVLLAGRVAESSDSLAEGGRGGWVWGRRMKIILFALAVLSAFAGIGQSGPAQAGAFVGGGMLLLAATLLAMHGRLSRPIARPGRSATAGEQSGAATAGAPSGVARRGYSLPLLAWTNVGRNPLRSTLSIGLMACASFLIVSISAFQLTPTESGVGGFDLIGQTATPLYRDLNDPAVRAELLGGEADKWGGSEVVSLRVRPGQDASCNNLYQAAQPQVLGVPREIASVTSRTPFQWAAATSPPAHATSPPAETPPASDSWSPWEALDLEAAGTADDPVPLVLDQNTAMWSLQMRGGVGEVRVFSWREGEPIHFRVVGLLANSVLQGSLMIGQRNFERHFPDISGHRMFLVRTDAPETVRPMLENRLGDIGMALTPSRTVLARLMAVQNTYLRTFQSLGALGLLLGTIGLAIAQLRNALERQGELALMRAIGFARGRLASAVMLETVFVLAAGIGSGVVCAAIAVTPYLLTGQSPPPIVGPLVSVLMIAAFGLAAGSLAVAKVIRMPLVAALRK